MLLETIQYLSRGKIIQTEKRELAQIKFAKIRPGSRDEFVNRKLYVPPLPPTNIRNSNIIRLNYDVYVSEAINLPYSFLIAETPKKNSEVIRILFYLVILIRGINSHVSSLTHFSFPVDNRAEVDGEGDKTSITNTVGNVPVQVDQRRVDELARLGLET